MLGYYETLGIKIYFIWKSYHGYQKNIRVSEVGLCIYGKCVKIHLLVHFWVLRTLPLCPEGVKTPRVEVSWDDEA